MKALLALEDGFVLEGRSFTGPCEGGGEVIFNTGMTGYQEILTDPSYYGQMVCMTWPLIGNYGINAEDMESGKVTPQLLQTIADQLRQCAPEQAADWCWLLGTRLVFTVLPLAKEALAALPQLERDAFFVQAEQFLRETATALGDQPQPLTKPDFAKLTEQYGKLLPVDSKEKLRRYARLYPTLACTKFPIRQKNGYVWLPEQPVRQSAKAASDGITLPEIRRELLLKQLQLPPEKIALEQVYPLCYEDMGFFSENGSHRNRGEDFLKEAPQLLQDYEAQHGKVLRERYSPEEWDWFRQAAD